MNPNKSWNDSNHNLNYLPQVITYQHHILSFEIRELNLLALAQHWVNSAASFKVLPSRGAVASPLSSQSYVKPKFRRPQTHPYGKHPDPMIKHFRALLHNSQDATHRMAI
jgi:hypothetical protein